MELMRGLSNGEFAFVVATATGMMLLFGISVRYSTATAAKNDSNKPIECNNQNEKTRISSEQFALEVKIARIVAGVTIIGCCCFTQSLDAAVKLLWEEYLLTSGLFRHDSWEPLIASLSFASVILIWLVIDFHIPALHRYRLKSDDMNSWMGRESLIFREFAWYLAPLLVIDFFFPRRKLPLEAPTFLQIVWQIALALFVFDFIFFCGHMCFHRFNFLYRSIHAEHHSSYNTRASDAIRHTFWDGTWDVVCSVLALNLTGAHPLSRSLYNVVAITLITEVTHCSMALPMLI